MPVDAYRDGVRLVVRFDMPGVHPDSTELRVDRKVLTV
jgi:HSP20 family molecular chaperone IbpA